jgi:hypothetical protein
MRIISRQALWDDEAFSGMARSGWSANAILGAHVIARSKTIKRTASENLFISPPIIGDLNMRLLQKGVTPAKAGVQRLSNTLKNWIPVSPE